MGANVFPSYSRQVTNYTLQSEESESINLQGLQFNYNESQFIATVNNKYEKIINFKKEGSNIFFETDSLLITPDISKPTTNIIVKNKTKSVFSYTLYVVPWLDIYQDEINEIKKSLSNNSFNFSKTFPSIEFVPSNIVSTLTHNLDKSVSELTVNVFDFSENPTIKRPVYGKFVGGIFQIGDIVISQNQANPNNAIDVKFNSEVKPSYCLLKLEGRSLTLELLDSQNKNYNYSNRNLDQGTSELIKHNLNIDVSTLPIHVKIEYLVNGKAVFVPANRPRTLKFGKIGNSTLVNLLNQDILSDNGNISLIISSENPNKELKIENNVNLVSNNFKSIGYTIDVSEVFIGLTLHIELEHL
ncbi:hypothetical protein GCL60_16475 [Silvanigrella paludirubra]|uniref:Uncharacterized protein n=1 Tax=Silvanigrella paludirubra TaxID=2499159 RepID=A0A6N6VN52_9BACT|nr:hypothetical protein [Silvanigrella paludirubra]KAB8035824.1 hypothetical protein GCL60_16475 [Silvanigrella paludirubra]